LHLPDGTQTAPNHFLGDFPSHKWKYLAPHLPTDLTGWRALDIGCNAGFYVFELARRGAEVTAIDIDPRYLVQACWAATQYGVQNQVEFRRMHVVEAMLRSCGMRMLGRLPHELFICEPNPDSPSCVSTWNTAELLSATGRPWLNGAAG
jgi:SAM-dependent methyltransferase